MSSLLLDDTLQPFVDGVVNKLLRVFAPLSDSQSHMLELLNWSKSSPAVHCLLNDAQTSVTDCGLFWLTSYF